MAATILILGLAILCIGLAWTLLQSNHVVVRNLADWESNRYEIDIEPLKNLLDRGEERYLRTHLSRAQFCSFQRKRIRLALDMLKLVEANAHMLMRLGQLAKMSNEQILAQRGAELSASALRLRWSMVLLRLCLSARWVFPAWPVALPAFEASYQELMDRFVFVQQSYRHVTP
jgi:hypothetical protein